VRAHTPNAGEKKEPQKTAKNRKKGQKSVDFIFGGLAMAGFPVFILCSLRPPFISLSLRESQHSRGIIQ
jgi:hypothetical protein